MGTLQPLTDPSTYTTHTQSLPPQTLHIIYFHAPWAAPCARMSEILTALASTYPTYSLSSSDPSGKVISFTSVDAEELPDIAEEHEVSAVPFIVLQRGGKTLETVSGADAAKVREAVERHYIGPDGQAVNGGGKAPLQTIPPAQKVTRPDPLEQPTAPAPPSAAANPALPAKSAEASNATTSHLARNLSAYAPDTSDPATAPAFSSSNGTANDPPKKHPADEEDLQTRLSSLVKAAPVMLFMKGTPSAPQCGFSRQLVSILRENSVKYGFFNILADEEVRQGLKEYAEWPTYPQLWLDGELAGGLDIVKEELEGDARFFDGYSVDAGARNKGGPAGKEEQRTPQVAG